MITATLFAIVNDPPIDPPTSSGIRAYAVAAGVIASVLFGLIAMFSPSSFRKILIALGIVLLLGMVAGGLVGDVFDLGRDGQLSGTGGE